MDPTEITVLFSQHNLSFPMHLKFLMELSQWSEKLAIAATWTDLKFREDFFVIKKRLIKISASHLKIYFYFLSWRILHDWQQLIARV